MVMPVHCDIVSDGTSYFFWLGRASRLPTAHWVISVVQFGHAPLLTELKPGPVRVRKQTWEEEFLRLGGYLEVQPYSIVI